MRRVLAGAAATRRRRPPCRWLLLGRLILVFRRRRRQLGTAAAGGAAAPVTVRLGYLANITHAPALIAVKNGYFTKELGSAGTVKTTVFTSGTQETTAILAGQLDAAYVGPNPAINAWQKSNGTAIKVISGVATGGASIVVKPSVTSAAQLKGQSAGQPRRSATPRTWRCATGSSSRG